MPAAARPFHEVGSALVRDFLPVVSRDNRRADAPAILANHLERMPRLRAHRAANLLVDAADHVRLAQNGLDGLIEPARPVNVPQPVELRTDAQLGEHPEKLRDVVLRHVLGRRPGRRRRVAQRRPKVLLEMLRRAVGYLVHRVIVVHPEKVSRRNAFGPERAENDIVDQRPAQRANVGAPRRRLRIVDRLRPVGRL